MAMKLSNRLLAIVDALPLREGLRVLEIGCGPGAAAREIARRIGGGQVLAIDRSARAIAQAEGGSSDQIASGHLSFRCVAVGDFELAAGEDRFDLAVAVPQCTGSSTRGRPQRDYRRLRRAAKLKAD